MARQKRKSVVIEKANKRFAGLESISTTLDLGNNLTVVNFSSKLNAVVSQLDSYNQLLSELDGKLTTLKQMEKELREFSQSMLETVGAVFGHDSVEFEKAGGVRKSARKRPVRKPKVS